MTLCDYIKRVIRYGPKGIVLWTRIKWGEYKARRFFMRNARRFDLTPVRGVTLIGSFTGHDSISKVMRDFLFAVHDAGIPYQTFSTGGDGNPVQMGVADLLTPIEEFRIKKYSLVVEMFNGFVPDDLMLDIANVAFWEFEDGFLPVYPQFTHKKHIIGMSDFVVETLRRELPRSTEVSKLLYPFRCSTGDIKPRADIRKRFKIKQDAFVVFFNFDFASGFNRKNPEGAIRAFAKAFKDTKDAFLVFKTMRSNGFPERVACLEQLAVELGVRDRFIMIHEYLSDVDIYSLTNACDVYLSLHRGEGFGLGVAEAMLLGLSVVVSDYSATTEFCNPSNAILVPCKIVPPRQNQRDHLTYSYVTKWADPDISFAANALIRIYNNPSMRAHIGLYAREYIIEYFSLGRFKESLEKLLHDNFHNEIVRHFVWK